MITGLVLAAAMAALPTEARGGGQDLPALAEAWWRWAYQPRDGMRPTQDPTGARCHVGQVGKVWFLAGTDGTGAAERTCAVPEGRQLLVPVFVVLEHSRPGHRRDCAALRSAAAAEASSELSLRVALDGAPLAPARSASRDCFDAWADAVDDAPPPGLYAPATTDGWWLLLPPLPPGRHHLQVVARQASEGVARGRHDQQFTYVLDVGGDGAPPSEAESLPDASSDAITL